MPEKVFYRGEELFLEDALMQVPLQELCEIEVVLEDGSTVRPFRFCDPCPVVSRDEHGILAVG